MSSKSIHVNIRSLLRYCFNSGSNVVNVLDRLAPNESGMSKVINLHCFVGRVAQSLEKYFGVLNVS